MRPGHTHKVRVCRSSMAMLPSWRKLVGVHMATKSADISPLVSQSEHRLSVNWFQTYFNRSSMVPTFLLNISATSHRNLSQ